MLHYVEQGSGEVIVLLHGFCGSSQYWQAIMPHLSIKFRVVAPDLAGQGKSKIQKKDSYTMEDYAEQILQLLDHLQIDKATLLGHSMGGYITLAFAELYSERMRAFGLIHSTAYPDDEKGKTGRDKSIASIQANGIQSFVDGLAPKLFAPNNIEVKRDAIQQVKEIGYQTTEAGAIAALEAMKLRADRTQVLEQSDLPILLVAGEYDQLIAPEKTFTSKGPRIAHYLVRGAGHMSMYEDPKQLLIGIEQFMNFVTNHHK